MRHTYLLHALVILLTVLLAGCRVERLSLGARASGEKARSTGDPFGEATMVVATDAAATSTPQPEAQQTPPPLPLPPTPTATTVPTVVAGSDLQAALIGEWRCVTASPNVQDLWIFRPDGRFAFTAGNQVIEGGRYKVGNDNYVEIEFARGVAKTFAVFFVEGRLILEDRDRTNRVTLERKQ